MLEGEQAVQALEGRAGCLGARGEQAVQVL